MNPNCNCLIVVPEPALIVWLYLLVLMKNECISKNETDAVQSLQHDKLKKL